MPHATPHVCALSAGVAQLSQLKVRPPLNTGRVPGRARRAPRRAHSMSDTFNLLEKRLLQEGREVLSDLKSVDGNVNGGHALWRTLAALNDVLARELLEGDVVVVLQEKVWHHLRISLGLCAHHLLELLVGRLGAEDLLPILGHNGNRVAARVGAAPVDLQANSVAILGLDSEADAREVGELLARRAGERLAGGEFGVWSDALDVVHSDTPVGSEQGELMNRHVLEHTLSVAFEALGELRLLVGVVMHIRGDRAGVGLGSLERLAHVGRDVLVVAHEDRHSLLLCVGTHLLKLGNGWRARLLEVDSFAAHVDHLLEEPGVVGGAPGDECHRRSRDLDILERVGELGAVLGLHLSGPLGKHLARRRVCALSKEPRLDDGGELRAGHISVQHLLRVVPAHPPLGHSTADEDDITLLRGGRRASTQAAERRGRGARVELERLELIEHSAPSERRWVAPLAPCGERERRGGEEEHGGRKAGGGKGRAGRGERGGTF
mmetsp:Transcript_8291/g.23106  ORF Transcript_8291/g.23106 Transcript_8291/m.23106 type:complete len:492 (+) Transcript_8291:215-1690(+)